MAGAAINLRSRTGVATVVGKLRAVITQIWSAADPHIISASSAPHYQLEAFRRWRRAAIHASAYEKNIDEQVMRPTIDDVVPDDQLRMTDKYWAPNPHTGVFGPNVAAAGGGEEEAVAAESSVLEEKAWFRPTSLEDLEKPASHHHH